jgi:hypothetical protein
MFNNLCRSLATAVLLLIALIAIPAFAEDKVTRERIAFALGTSEATAKAQVQGYDSYEYLVGASADQTMSVTFTTDNTSAYFNIWAPGKKLGQDEAMFIGSTSGNVFSQKLAETGDYVVQVYLYRNAARRNEKSNFTVTVKVTSEVAQSEPSPDFADGLMGGPDFWQIKGVFAGKTVNLRREASTSSAVVKQLPLATVLRNKGCKMVDAQRWCNVEEPEDSSLSGWVAGQFLAEAAPPESGARPDDALVKGTNYHAVGRIPCALDGQSDVEDCEFGVTRGTPGVATIFITVPNGFVRVLAFDNGKVAPQSGVTSFSSTREDDNTIVKVNGVDEKYTIPDAVINGG